MNLTNIDVVRVPAIYKPQRGALGCSLSHIHALQCFIESNLNTCCIFEDDFEFVLDSEIVHALFATLKRGHILFDVCMLSGGINKSESAQNTSLLKVLDGQTAAGYCVTKDFAPTLMKNFQEGARHLEAGFDTTGRQVGSFCIDQYWKKLQPLHDWYVLHPKMGKQRESYSDIEGKIVNYGC